MRSFHLKPIWQSPLFWILSVSVISFNFFSVSAKFPAAIYYVCLGNCRIESADILFWRTPKFFAKVKSRWTADCELTRNPSCVRDVGGKKRGRIMKITGRGAKGRLKEAVDLISRDVAEIAVCLLEFLYACMSSEMDLLPDVRQSDCLMPSKRKSCKTYLAYFELSKLIASCHVTYGFTFLPQDVLQDSRPDWRQSDYWLEAREWLPKCLTYDKQTGLQKKIFTAA